MSDIHGNADALRAVLEDAERWDYLVVLGDLVDYGPEPHLVLDMIRELKPEVTIMGNHDHAVAFNTDCRCAPDLHELSEYTRRNISMKLLSEDQIEWLKTLPIRTEKEIAGRRFYLVHGSPRNPLYGYLMPNLSVEELKLQLTPSITAVSPRPLNVDYVLVGHTHIPMEVEVGKIVVVNPGSCGQPRDGDPRASYAVYDMESGKFSIFRVKYDVEAVIRKIHSLGLEERYAEWLTKILSRGRVI